MDKGYTKKQVISLIMGPVLLLLAVLLLPGGVFNFPQRIAVGSVLWMGLWWITTPVSVAVTGMLPVIINAIFLVVPSSSVIGCYSSEIVILLLGADLLTLSWMTTGLDKRIALKALCLLGPSATQQIIFWITLSAVLSMVLPNVVVCAALCPIAFSMLNYVTEDTPQGNRMRAIILAAVAWGAGIGGLGSPLGGAMNLVSVEYIEQITGKEFMYVDWVVRLLPVMVILLLINIAYLLIIKPKKMTLQGSKVYFEQQYQEMPKISRDEIISAGLFIATMAMVFMRGMFASTFPGLKPAYIFALFGIFTFFIPTKSKKPLVRWEEAEKEVGWTLLILFAGGLAVGKMVSESGAAVSLAGVLSSLNLDGGFLTILLFVTFTVLVAEVSSNTAAAAICLPVVISVTQSLGLNVVPYILITSAAFNVAYMLPTSIRAIPVSYGLKPSYLFKNGAVLTISNILAISVLGYLFIQMWPGFGILS